MCMRTNLHKADAECKLRPFCGTLELLCTGEGRGLKVASNHEGWNIHYTTIHYFNVHQNQFRNQRLFLKMFLLQREFYSLTTFLESRIRSWTAALSKLPKLKRQIDDKVDKPNILFLYKVIEMEKRTIIAGKNGMYLSSDVKWDFDLKFTGYLIIMS